MNKIRKFWKGLVDSVRGKVGGRKTRIGVKGHPVHINPPPGSPRVIRRHYGRLARLHDRLENDNLTRVEAMEIREEIANRTQVLLGMKLPVPETVPELEALAQDPDKKK